MSYSQNVEDAASEFENKVKVYQAWLGYYKAHSRAMGWDDERLVAEANKFALEALGTGEVPGLQKSIVGKMGLKGVRGLNVIPNAPKPPRGGRGEGRSAGAGGRGEVAGRNGHGRGGRGGE